MGISNKFLGDADAAGLGTRPALPRGTASRKILEKENLPLFTFLWYLRAPSMLRPPGSTGWLTHLADAPQAVR